MIIKPLICIGHRVYRENSEADKDYWGTKQMIELQDGGKKGSRIIKDTKTNVLNAKSIFLQIE